jgi:predicted GNAT family acetyltransferase
MANMGTVLSYHEIRPGVLELRSTLVPPHLRGRGVGTQLVRQSLDCVRQNDYQIVPTCPFVQDFLDKNPEYQDLIAEEN